MKPIYMYVALAAVAVWFLFLRKRTNVTGGANLSIATGNNATPYTGYPAGQTPPGTPIYGAGAYAGAAPPPPSPYVDSTGSTLAGVGSLLGGLGQGIGGILGGLGSSGLIGGSSGGGSYDSGGGDSYDSYGDW